MTLHDPAGDNPAVPVLLDRLRTGDEHDRRVAAEVLTALNPRYAELPELLATVKEALEQRDSEWDFDDEAVAAAEQLVELVGPQAEEVIPILVRAVLDHDSAEHLAVFGAVGCEALLEAFDGTCQCDDDRLSSGILGGIEDIIRTDARSVTPDLLRRMNRVLDCYDGSEVRNAACGVLGACGRLAAPLAISPLLIYRMEAVREGWDDAVYAAECALEAIAPDDPEVRKELDADPTDDEDPNG